MTKYSDLSVTAFPKACNGLTAESGFMVLWGFGHLGLTGSIGLWGLGLRVQGSSLQLECRGAGDLGSCCLHGRLGREAPSPHFGPPDDSKLGPRPKATLHPQLSPEL